jgi:hypothetical protein
VTFGDCMGAIAGASARIIRRTVGGFTYIAFEAASASVACWPHSPTAAVVVAVA